MLCRTPLLWLSLFALFLLAAQGLVSPLLPQLGEKSSQKAEEEPKRLHAQNPQLP